MNITFTLNGKKISRQIEADTLLIDLVRDLGCYSVKRGCETSNCGLCTVFMDDQPILSCSILAARVDGHKIDYYSTNDETTPTSSSSPEIDGLDRDRGR